MMRRPPSVSSSCDSKSPHNVCASVLCAFRRLLTCPMMMPASGATTITNTVSCQLTNIIVEKQTTIAIGWRISMSMELVSELSTWATSALMRATMSPRLSDEKNASGRLSTFLYTSMRMSFTMPVRSGNITDRDAKYPNVFSAVIMVSPAPIRQRV